MRTKSWKIGLLGLAMTPLLGATCTVDKAIDFVVKAQSVAQFEARGSINVDLGDDEYDLKEDVDIQQIASDYEVDPSDIKSATFRQLCVKITKADVHSPDRAISGNLTIEFKDTNLGSLGVVNLGSLTDFPANAVSDEWIDITESVTEAGVAAINAFLSRCVDELHGGPAAAYTIVHYVWVGVSTPTGVETNFDWEVKVALNVIPTVTAELPDF